MAERACPRCNVPSPPRLKFCRECGARLAGAPEGPPPGGKESDGGDRTIFAGSAATGGDAGGSAPEDAGDRTIMAGSPVKGESPPPKADPGEGTVTAAPGRAAPPDDAGDATLIGGSVGGGAREPSPPTEITSPGSPPPPPPEEEDPVSDDPGEDDDTGATLAASLRAAPPPLEEIDLPAPSGPAPPAPPPPSPPPAPSGRAPQEDVPTPAGVLRLDHWSPRVKEGTVPLEGEETLVGRDRGDVTFPGDNYLSRKHARFYRDGEGRLCVEDLGTLNGTYLRLRAPVELEHRDVLSIGRHVLRFELLQYDEVDDRTIEGDPLTRVQGVQGTPPRARLVKRQEEGFSGIPFFFGTRKYVLGRSEGTHRFTSDDRMSRRHASLSFHEGKYVLEDLGSQNGTFLRLRGPRVLEPGDVVKMGDQYFRVPG